MIFCDYKDMGIVLAVFGNGIWNKCLNWVCKYDTLLLFKVSAQFVPKGRRNWYQIKNVFKVCDWGSNVPG
jgi:hypothetical protein